MKIKMYGVPFIVYKSAFPYLEFRNSTSAYDEYETKRNKELPYQGMSQYFVKVLNTQYQ